MEENKKWDFSDYAYTITGIIVGVLLVVPDVLESQFGLSIMGGSLSNTVPTLVDGMEYGNGYNIWDIRQLRALSPMLFLLTTTVVFFKEAADARKNGGYKGSLFTHTFESLFEDGIYMAITTIMVYGAILTGAMYASWLAGPITWILFIFIFPFVKKKSSNIDAIDDADTPWFLLFMFAIGVVAEVITGAWVALPLSWLIICVFKLSDIICKGNYSIDTVFDIMYYAFSVILMAVGIILDFWITSWAAFPIALIICWILSKFKRFKNIKAEE